MKQLNAAVPSDCAKDVLRVLEIECMLKNLVRLEHNGIALITAPCDDHVSPLLLCQHAPFELTTHVRPVLVCGPCKCDRRCVASSCTSWTESAVEVCACSRNTDIMVMMGLQFLADMVPC